MLPRDVKGGEGMIGAEECNAKLKELRTLRTRRLELDKESKDIKEKEGLLNAELTEYFEVTGQQSIDLEGYGKFYLNREVYPHIQDQDSLEVWLDGQGDLELIKTFNSNKFKAYYKERLANNEELPPFCDQFVKTEIRMRRS